jgi:hypothetical protein
MLVEVIYIRSRRFFLGRDGHPALKCNPDGKIQANCWGPGKTWEEWILIPISNNDDSCPTTCRVAFESWTGQFLSAKLDGTVFAADVLDEGCHWELQSTTGNFVSLKSHFGKYLCCDDLIKPGKSVRADRRAANEWEEWIIVNDPNELTKKGETARLAVGTLVGVGTLVALGAVAIPVVGFGIEQLAVCAGCRLLHCAAAATLTCIVVAYGGGDIAGAGREKAGYLATCKQH